MFCIRARLSRGFGPLHVPKSGVRACGPQNCAHTFSRVRVHAGVTTQRARAWYSNTCVTPPHQPGLHASVLTRAVALVLTRPARFPSRTLRHRSSFARAAGPRARVTDYQSTRSWTDRSRAPPLAVTIPPRRWGPYRWNGTFMTTRTATLVLLPYTRPEVVSKSTVRLDPASAEKNKIFCFHPTSAVNDLTSRM
jgi:hypothetical protein